MIPSEILFVVGHLHQVTLDETTGYKPITADKPSAHQEIWLNGRSEKGIKEIH
jgi:hypothetical protein